VTGEKKCFFFLRRIYLAPVAAGIPIFVIILIVLAFLFLICVLSTGNRRKKNTKRDGWDLF
jgi:hypothetical protein